MSVTLTVSEEIARHLNQLLLGENLNDHLRRLLVAEYRRKLTRYNLTNRQLSQKYQMSFDEFEHHQVTQQHNYSWEVESDAMAWETAIDGSRTLQRQLAELEVLL
jgi:hypothetical protein